MESLNENPRLIANVVRLGTVLDVDLANARCRVKSGKLDSAWLAWREVRAGETRTWNPPTIGEQVLVLCPSGDPAQAVVLTGIFSDSNPAPSSSASEHVVLYPDGARICYDHSSGHLDVTGIVTATLQASGDVVIDSPITRFTGQVVIEGLLTYQAGLSGKNGGGNATSIQGSITHVGGDLSSNGIVVHTHTHGGVEAGNSSSGGPQ